MISAISVGEGLDAPEFLPACPAELGAWSRQSPPHCHLSTHGYGAPQHCRRQRRLRQASQSRRLGSALMPCRRASMAHSKCRDRADDAAFDLAPTAEARPGHPVPSAYGVAMTAVSPSCPIRTALAQLPQTCFGRRPCAPSVRKLRRCRPRTSSSGFTTAGARTRPLS